eukprot:Tbor_TRINITY_DN3711_c0_g1::TRINITY_DN3711_c0_g1_i1::g.2332::m.2332
MGRGKKGKKPASGAPVEDDSEEDTQDFLAALQRASNEDPDSINKESNTDMNNTETEDKEEKEENKVSRKNEKKLPKKVLEAQKQAAAAEEAKKEKEREKLAEETKVSNHDEECNSVDDSDNASYDTSDEEDDDMPICYPIKMLYCPHCTFPLDMCEYGGMYEDKCKGWLISQAEEGVKEARRALNTASGVVIKGRKRKILTEAERLHKALTKGGRKEINKEVHFTVVHRVGKKFLTQIKGLDLFGFVLKDVCKDLKKVLSTGASVAEHTGNMSVIEVQGDVVEQVVNILTKKMNLPKNKLFLVDKDHKTCLGEANMVMLNTKPKKKEVVKKEPVICPQQTPDFVTGNKVVKEAIVVEVYESSEDEEPNTEEVKKTTKPAASRRSGPSKRGTKNLL